MCGIVGLVNHGQALRLTVDALKRLEYRGYDSFGIATVQPNGIAVHKAVGSIVEEDQAGGLNCVPDGALAIGHTRWATHGEVTVANAHPHLSFDGRFALVHNGVIDNYQALRQRLAASGIKCQSQTDSEVIVHLLAWHYRRCNDSLEALRLTVQQLHGEYACAFINRDEPDSLYGMRQKSPLAYGLADGLTILASDQQAMTPMTTSATFMEDGDLVRLKAGNVACWRLQSGRIMSVTRPSITLAEPEQDGDKKGYDHFMLKEISESPAAVEVVTSLPEDALGPIVQDMAQKRVCITGAGSAFYAAKMGQYYFSALAGQYVCTHQADEILALVPISGADHVIAVSQSGETYDTLEVMRQALSAGATITAVNNVAGSSAQRLATFPLFQGAGPERCVLSTKSIISQIAILYRLALLQGHVNGLLNRRQAEGYLSDLAQMPARMQRLLDEYRETIGNLAREHSHIENWFFIGRGIHYPVALESALKFKEVSYAHAEGLPAGFFKHGTISLIDERFRTVAFLPNQALDPSVHSLTKSNIAEIQARGGVVMTIAHDPTPAVSEETPLSITLRSVNRFLDPILQLLVGQLLAYETAVHLGRNVDRPRALAKSVTVR